MATIADRSRTKEIIERLQAILDTAPSVPLAAGKISIYKDEVQTLLSELSTQMDMEIKTYHEVNDRKGKILSEAKKEAERIIFEAEHSASRMRVTKHTTGVAPVDYNMLNDEERSALGNANEIYAASLIYTDEMLTEVTEMISTAYHNIRSDYEIILQVMEEKMNVLSNNRAELMDGLQEMGPDDRSQQILEIGQLLSSELYNARMKARTNPDEYKDGSIQLTLDLQEEQEEKTRQAEEKAQRAEAALAQMIAERDALAEKVERLKNDGMKATLHATPFLSGNKAVGESITNKSNESEEDVEYEIVYVTEDELEEGEEYEIEYVDDFEENGPETVAESKVEKFISEKKATTDKVAMEKADAELVDKIEGAADKVEAKVTALGDKVEGATDKAETKAEKETTDQPEQVEAMKTAEPVKVETPEEKAAKEKEVAEAIKELEELDKENETIPLIPHFKKSESVASVPAERVAPMATAMTTEKKYSGLIGRAVKQREQAQLDETVTTVDEFSSVTTKGLIKKETAQKKDEDIRTDAYGREYVQATMMFDDNYEITDF
ncbi:MAG: hypothetical protein IJP29_02645 [Lachnospiraceae bacterium]|nr:hypothetical protein [Lachnospiraceae bacterium]